MDISENKNNTPLNLAETENKQKSAILIVEDNADIRAFLKENLAPIYKIYEAENGIEALEKAKKEQPALIVSDIAMPEMDGITLCGHIKSIIETSHIPVILLTARTSLVFKVDGLEKGADDYITKPFNIQLLMTRIHNLIESRKKLHQRFQTQNYLSPADIKISSTDEKFLNKINGVIEDNIENSDFTVDELAKKMYMNRLKLYRKLRGLIGQTPNQIITKFRLKRAAQLLQSNQYNVREVTYMVGYNDLKSFRTQFKKEYGISPSQYSKGLDK